MTDMKLDDAPDGAAAGGAAPPTIQIPVYTTYKDKTDHTLRVYPNAQQNFAEWPQLVNGHQLLIGDKNGIVITENEERVGMYRGFKRKGARVRIITFRDTTRLQSKSNRCI